MFWFEVLTVGLCVCSLVCFVFTMCVCLHCAGDPNRNWPSENDLFDDDLEAHSMGSVQSYDRSVENIVQRRSRVSSQENGWCQLIPTPETNLFHPAPSVACERLLPREFETFLGIEACEISRPVVDG